jgi:hypothetical protein
VKEIKTREDFIAFLDAFRSDLNTSPLGWQNSDLASFLEAMKAWTTDMDGYYASRGLPLPPEPGWQTFVDILNGARIYE